jgi:hypothetical protein
MSVADVRTEADRLAGPTPRLHLTRPLADADVAKLEPVLCDDRCWDALPKLAEGHRSSVARLGLSSGPVVVKRYLEPAGYRLRTLGRLSRGKREARAMAHLAMALPDDPVRVVAWAEARHVGLVTRSFVVATELADSFDLRSVKRMAAEDRGPVVEAVLSVLPERVARLHAGGVFAQALRGKNVLFQPSTGRIALIDQPYARRLRRLRLRHRVYDLATLSLELRRFLDDAQWSRFLAAYRSHCREIEGWEDPRLGEDRIAQSAARAGHDTRLNAWWRGLARRFRRSPLGEWLTGQRRERES